MGVELLCSELGLCTQGCALPLPDYQGPGDHIRKISTAVNKLASLNWAIVKENSNFFCTLQ